MSGYEWDKTNGAGLHDDIQSVTLVLQRWKGKEEGGQIHGIFVTVGSQILLKASRNGASRSHNYPRILAPQGEASMWRGLKSGVAGVDATVRQLLGLWIHCGHFEGH